MKGRSLPVSGGSTLKIKWADCLLALRLQRHRSFRSFSVHAMWLLLSLSLLFTNHPEVLTSVLNVAACSLHPGSPLTKPATWRTKKINIQKTASDKRRSMRVYLLIVILYMPLLTLNRSPDCQNEGSSSPRHPEKPLLNIHAQLRSPWTTSRLHVGWVDSEFVCLLFWCLHSLSV